jgi:uncharacterized linocin/CFP29 family protein
LALADNLPLSVINHTICFKGSIMLDFLSHNEAPISDTQWDEIDALVVEVVRKQLVGRRFINVFGPLGAGIQWVGIDHLEGAGKGSLDALGESTPAEDMIRSIKRTNIHLPLLYKDFMLYWRDIETSRKFAVPLDLSTAAAAAAACARTEDEMIFNGFVDLESGVEHHGLLNVPGRHELVRSNWQEPGSVFQDVLRGTEQLAEGGFYGPYALVVSPRVYSQLHRYMNVTGMLEIEYIRQIVTQGVFSSSVVPEDAMVLVSTGVQNMDLAIAQDYKTAYLGAQNMNHPFRVLASLALRIKRPGAICVLRGGESAGNPPNTRRQAVRVTEPTPVEGGTDTPTETFEEAPPRRRGRRPGGNTTTTRPASRRGRPARAAADSRVALTLADEAPDADAPPRRRGRPPAPGKAVTSATPLRRGRPKKLTADVPDATMETTEDAAAPRTGKRGRPAKATSKKTAPKSRGRKATGTKKAVGRPAKSATASTGKRPGRPPRAAEAPVTHQSAPPPFDDIPETFNAVLEAFEGDVS